MKTRCIPEDYLAALVGLYLHQKAYYDLMESDDQAFDVKAEHLMDLVSDDVDRITDLRAAVAEDVRQEIVSSSASALGRLGGAKGGAARAKALSPERRSEIARQGAQARWDRKRAEGVVR